MVDCYYASVTLFGRIKMAPVETNNVFHTKGSEYVSSKITMPSFLGVENDEFRLATFILF